MPRPVPANGVEGRAPQSREQMSRSTLNDEVNIESIRALEERIREHERIITNLKRAPTTSLDMPTLSPQLTPSDKANIERTQVLEGQTREHEWAIIKLKRTRNSLLNVSKLPPEVLDKIFCWNVIPRDDFWGWEVRSYTFLLVCHHWFEVASQTPELWSFWGTTPKEWKWYCHRSMNTPLSLALDGLLNYFIVSSLDITLRDTLRDRAIRDSIRRVHLRASDSELLRSILSSLTVDGEGFKSNSVESFTIIAFSGAQLDISDFFARYNFPKLQHLELAGCTITWLDRLISRTGALATLIICGGFCPPAVTASKVLSIFASNPALRKVKLSVGATTNPSGSGSLFRVPLHNLEHLTLSGDTQDIVAILSRLDYGRKMDLFLDLHECSVGDISKDIKPYLRDYVGRRGRPQNGLALLVSYYSKTITHLVGDVNNLDPCTPETDRVTWFTTIDIQLNEKLPEDLLERAILDLISHTPQEEVIYIVVTNDPITMGAMSAQFPSLQSLHFVQTPLSTISGLGGGREIFPSLRSVFLDTVGVYDDNWSLFAGSLSRRASFGNRLDVLHISHSSHMCTEVVENIRSATRHFFIEDPSPPSSFDTCLGP